VTRVGVLTFSDGRAQVHADLEGFGQRVEGQIVEALETCGFEVIRAAGTVWSNELAVSEARRLAAKAPRRT
jgi:hypothetical protein